jgi:hypothetical protein
MILLINDFTYNMELKNIRNVILINVISKVVASKVLISTAVVSFYQLSPILLNQDGLEATLGFNVFTHGNNS